MSVEALRGLILQHYSWALEMDWAARDAVARAWYVSAEKLEPRLGERFEEPIAEYEQPLAPGRDVAALFAALEGRNGSVAAFLMECPEHRGAVKRAQVLARFPYAEIRDNTIASEMLPIDLLRCKLSFFGAWCGLLCFGARLSRMSWPIGRTMLGPMGHEPVAGGVGGADAESCPWRWAELGAGG